MTPLTSQGLRSTEGEDVQATREHLHSESQPQLTRAASGRLKVSNAKHGKMSDQTHFTCRSKTGAKSDLKESFLKLNSL